MSEKKSSKVDLESRLVNFFLLGCAIGLTLSLLALDIWASVKTSTGASFATEAEPAVEDLQMPNTDIETPPPPEPDQAPEQEEVVEQILKETQEEVATNFEFSMEADDETAIEGDDEETSTETETFDVEEAIVKVPQVRAEFPGGMAELRKYLAENCQYPEAARTAGWQGVVLLEFVVEKDGSIKQVTVLRSVCQALDEEAIRVVKGMPKWKAGENNGQKCRSFFQLPITFSLQ
jgi:protein TonB